MINDKADEVIDKHFKSLKNRYQNNLESMKGREFVFDYFHLLYYRCHKTNLNCGGSYIGSLGWIKSKKATINAVNKKDNKCLQYAVTVALNYEQIGKHPERIIKIKSFINKYCQQKKFPSEKDDWKKIEQNNVTTALNVLHAKKEKTGLAYVSKHNSNREKQVSILMIPKGEG